MRTLKILVLLIVLGFAGLVGYAYLGEFKPGTSERTSPVALPEALRVPDE